MDMVGQPLANSFNGLLKSVCLCEERKNPAEQIKSKIHKRLVYIQGCVVNV